MLRILRHNPNAAILLIGYSHGGNVNNIALNVLEECEIDISNITLVSAASPAMYDYRLNTNAQSQINGHFNFYNRRDATQTLYAQLTSSSSVMNVDGHPRGRAHHGAENIPVDRNVPRGFQNRWGAPAHSIMRTDTAIWYHYKINLIREATGW